MRDRTVALLVSVELLMSLGFGATATTLGWQGYSRAHDPLVLGLIARTRDRADRRRGIIELTDQGGRVLQELDRALHGVDDAVLSVLSERERATLNGLLARAVEAAAVQCAEQPEQGC